MANIGFWKVLSLLFALALLLPFFSHADDVKSQTNPTQVETTDHSSSTDSASPKGPADVLVSVYVLNIGKYDLNSGRYTIDFYIDFQHPVGIDPSKFEFVNGRASRPDLIISTPTEHFYRMQANLYDAVDLRKFPFDHQKLEIILEDKSKTINELRYLPLLEETDMDKSVMDFPGWNIDGWKAFTRIHDYPIWKEKYSQYVFEIDISRAPFNAFMKTFLPICFILLIIIASVLLPPSEAKKKLSIVGTGLAATVMFHLSIAKKIPAVGYLTFADKFMVLTYIVLLLSFAVTVWVVTVKNNPLKKDLINRVQNWTLILMLILVPAAYVLLFLLGA